MKADIAILGGGLSGLAAAVELSRRGRNVTIIEQSPRLGGRCYSYLDAKTGDTVDNGQHVLLGAYHETLRYLARIGTQKCLRSSPGLSLMMHHPEKGFSRFEVKAFPRPLHLTAAMLRYKALSLNDRASLVKVGLALQRRTVWTDELLATLTIDEWLSHLAQSREARRSLWNPIAISVMNEIPERASALLFARSLRAAFLGTKSDSAVLIPTVGQTELYVTPAEELLRRNGSKILLNSEVKQLHVKNGRIAGISLRNGKEMIPASVVSALPSYALARILPAEVAREDPWKEITHLSWSPIVSIHLWFDRHFMNEPVVGAIGKTVQWLFDRRSLVEHGSSSPSSYVSAVISGAYDEVKLTKHELVEIAVRDICALFPGSRNTRVLHSVVIKEKRATFSPTNGNNARRPPATTCFENLVLAGDWTDTGLPATIEGAIKSGVGAASLVADR